MGLCFGVPGVGKTVSARHYVEASHPDSSVFYTCPVIASPGKVEREIRMSRAQLHTAAKDRARRPAQAKLLRLLERAEELRDPQCNSMGFRSDEATQAEEAYFSQKERLVRLERTVRDPTSLLVVDEADRLKMAGLEQIRDIFDRGSLGLVLIGMPGLEKRLARFSQFYSRIGFVHEFRRLRSDETRRILSEGWTPPGVTLPKTKLDHESTAAIIRITGGNFRLLNRLLTQIERVLEVNELAVVTKAVVETARESLVIGQT